MTSLHGRTARLREAVIPGRLAEAMPGWLKDAVRPKPAPVPWGAMARAVLAICVPLSVGVVVGRRDIGLVLAMGGLTGTVMDTAGPYVVRVKQELTAAAFGGVAGLAIGKQCPSHRPLVFPAQVAQSAVGLSPEPGEDLGTLVARR